MLSAGSMAGMMNRTGWRILFPAAAGLSILLSAANLILGCLNQDEGWYLYAAGETARGAILYRDFMFTQGPGFPLVYGLFYPLIDALGVAGGRLISAMFGLGATACAVWLAGRIAAKEHRTAACAAALILTGINVTQSLFTTIVKTYALSAFFLTAGFAVLTYVRGRHRTAAAFGAGVLMALAACTRLSAGIALPLTGLWLLWTRVDVSTAAVSEQEDPGCRRRSGWVMPAWVAYGLGGGLTLLVLLGPYFLAGADRVLFALFGYHTGREAGGLLDNPVLKAGFISRFVQSFFVFAAGCVVVLFARRRRSVRIEMLRRAGPAPLLWTTGGAITLVHLMAPFPYDDYQTVVYPLLAAALASALAALCPQRQHLRAATALFLICTAAAFSSPVNQAWFVRGRNRIWWRLKEAPDLIVLQQAGEKIREMLGEGGLLLTQDTYLAIEARARVPRGMEMGPFSYYPDMPRNQAERMNVLNRKLLIELLAETQAPVAAFSGYALAIASPEIRELPEEEQAALRRALEVRYRKVARIEHFGQAHTPLEIFELIKKEQPGEASGSDPSGRAP